MRHGAHTDLREIDVNKRGIAAAGALLVTATMLTACGDSAPDTAAYDRCVDLVESRTKPQRMFLNDLRIEVLKGEVLQWVYDDEVAYYAENKMKLLDKCEEEHL